MDAAEGFVYMLEKKQFFLLTIFCLTLILWAIIPFTVQGAISKSIKRELAPTAAKIASIESSVSSLEENLASNAIEAAMAAYNIKFTGLTGQELYDKLESSAQNAVAVKNALRMRKSYEILYQRDRELTLAICEYYKINPPE